MVYLPSSNIETLQFLDVEDLLENTHNLFDDLWRHELYSYPQPRMQHLMTLIGTLIIQYIESQFKDVDIWKTVGNSKNTESYNLFEESIGLINRWLEICNRLTKLFWPNHALHQWIGEPFVPSTVMKFQDRLKEVMHYEINQARSQLGM